MSKLIKNFSIFIFAILLMSSVSYSQGEIKMNDSHEEKSDVPAGVKTADGMLYGSDYDNSAKVLTYGDLLVNAEGNNNQVILVKGVVAEVCQAMGCWMVMTDGITTVRATTGHKFLLPKDISGREVVISGTFKITEMSEDDARHYNEESPNPKKNEDIVGPQKVMLIEATGIKVLDAASDSK